MHRDFWLSVIRTVKWRWGFCEWNFCCVGVFFERNYLPLFFIVYVANSKDTSKGSAISERAPLMKSVPLGAQWNFVTQTDKKKHATFALMSLMSVSLQKYSWITQTNDTRILSSGGLRWYSEYFSRWLSNDQHCNEKRSGSGSLRTLQSYSQGQTLRNDLYQEEWNVDQEAFPIWTQRLPTCSWLLETDHELNSDDDRFEYSSKLEE